MLDQHLPGDLVLVARRNREVDLQERVRVAIEHPGGALFLEQVNILDERNVLLVGEPPARQVLGVDRARVFGLAHDPTSSRWGSRKSIGFSTWRSSSRSIRSTSSSPQTGRAH